MIFTVRKIAGWLAISAYLVMGAVVYSRVMANAGWHWPPDFHLLGYDSESIKPFLDTLTDKGRDGYVRVLRLYDRVFIVAFAAWMGLMAWRGSGIRYVVIGLAVVYALVDLAENTAILRVVQNVPAQAGIIEAAHHLTMAKFAALYLCVLVLIVHLRRS